jgi:hypothetical protein
MAMDTMPRALDMAFRTALLLTGATKSAEAAVIHGISAREELSPHGLLTDAVRSAVRLQASSANGPYEVECLPPKLRRLLMLPPLPRHCFVLRILMNLSSEVCAELLGVSVTVSEDALHAALIELPLLCSPKP